MSRRTRDDEDNYNFVTAAAAEHASCPVNDQRSHGQSKGKVEHDAFPPGNEVLVLGMPI